MNIHAESVQIGFNSFIHPTAVIKGIKGKAKKISIGDNTYIGADVQIICDDFEIGDYGKIHHHTNVHGVEPCKIGHNAWIGQYCMIDSTGGIRIGDNCGIGAHSQIWSHIKYGDVLEGCRFHSQKPMIVGNDVWFVGHCIVSPITAADKSMALAGSVITKDMDYNTVYAGTPAKAISDKIGLQFLEKTLEEKFSELHLLLKQSGVDSENIRIVKEELEVNFEDLETSYFCIKNRKYTKRLHDAETAFMKFLLPEKAKFVPF